MLALERTIHCLCRPGPPKTIYWLAHCTAALVAGQRQSGVSFVYAFYISLAEYPLVWLA